jgi:hypothetical protein
MFWGCSGGLDFDFDLVVRAAMLRLLMLAEHLHVSGFVWLQFHFGSCLTLDGGLVAGGGHAVPWLYVANSAHSGRCPASPYLLLEADAGLSLPGHVPCAECTCAPAPNGGYVPGGAVLVARDRHCMVHPAVLWLHGLPQIQSKCCQRCKVCVPQMQKTWPTSQGLCASEHYFCHGA